MAKDVVDKVTGEILYTWELPKLRASYDDHMQLSDDSGLACLDESLASQSAKDEADINVLVRRFGLTGQVPAGVVAPTYGDFTDLKTPHEMAQALVEAQAAFMAMPAEVRSQFDNDPHRFVDFCSKDENYDQMCDWGLLAPEPMQKRVEARRAKAEADRIAMVEAEIKRRQEAGK